MDALFHAFAYENLPWSKHGAGARGNAVAGHARKIQLHTNWDNTQIYAGMEYNEII